MVDFVIILDKLEVVSVGDDLSVGYAQIYAVVIVASFLDRKFLEHCSESCLILFLLLHVDLYALLVSVIGDINAINSHSRTIGYAFVPSLLLQFALVSIHHEVRYLISKVILDAFKALLVSNSLFFNLLKRLFDSLIESEKRCQS